jgi:hypothetical protein
MIFQPCVAGTILKDGKIAISGGTLLQLQAFTATAF